MDSRANAQTSRMMSRTHEQMNFNFTRVFNGDSFINGYYLHTLVKKKDSACYTAIDDEVMMQDTPGLNVTCGDLLERKEIFRSKEESKERKLNLGIMVLVMLESKECWNQVCTFDCTIKYVVKRNMKS